MMAKFDPCIAFTLQAEGGWSDDPLDPGGATNMGITLEGWSDNLGHKCTVADLRAMTRAQAEKYYQTYYWDVMGCSELPAGLDLEVFDFGVNAGPGRSVQLLQRMLGVPQDGRIGPQTAAKACGSDAVTRSRLASLANAHEAYYHALPGFAHDGRGWTARVNACLATAQALAAGMPSAPVKPALPKPRPMMITQPKSAVSRKQSPADDTETDDLNNASAAGTLNVGEPA